MLKLCSWCCTPKLVGVEMEKIMESRGRDEKKKEVQLLNKEHMGADFEDPKKGSRAEKFS